MKKLYSTFEEGPFFPTIREAAVHSHEEWEKYTKHWDSGIFPSPLLTTLYVKTEDGKVRKAGKKEHRILHSYLYVLAGFNL
ncbi:MAG: hypothetical protein D6767_03175 [Candidatus Hydrogenedentota bacterium]|nr:MAG: hypothetical protein D6767_03175 [Candidatus Hydrogenedentota bacterium]